MPNITYLMEKGNMSFNEVYTLPYIIFLSLLKQFRIRDLESTPEGRKLIAQSKWLKETKPDLSRIRNQKGYHKKITEK